MEENKEVLFNEEVSNKLVIGVNKLADAVLQTYGPNGNTVILFDHDKPYVTKDGVSVSNKVVLKDPTENAAATLIKEVAQLTLELAGDGTTTAIALAQLFINKGFNILLKDDYITIKKELEWLKEEVVFRLKEKAKPLNNDDLINVALVSCNNDTDSASIINEAYKHSRIVRVEESNNTNNSLNNITGLSLNGSYFDRAFINNAKKQSVEYTTNTKLLIVQGKLESLDNSFITNFIYSNKDYNICIMADHFSDEVVSILKDNYNKNALKVALIKSPGFAEHRKNLVWDIIRYTKASSLNSFYVADIDGLTATKNSLIINKKDVDVTGIVSILKESLKNETEDYSKELIQQRIDILQGTLSIIKVGGLSEIEMKEKRDRIDDAVLAVSCAIEEGTVEGGGITLSKIADELKEEGHKNRFIDCLYELSKLVFKTNNVNYNMLDDDIIDPVKVTRVALENAISVSKTILSSSAIVLPYGY